MTVDHIVKKYFLTLTRNQPHLILKFVFNHLERLTFHFKSTYILLQIMPKPFYVEEFKPLRFITAIKKVAILGLISAQM
jgi:hypothetical protein